MSGRCHRDPLRPCGPAASTRCDRTCEETRAAGVVVVVVVAAASAEVSLPFSVRHMDLGQSSLIGSGGHNADTHVR